MPSAALGHTVRTESGGCQRSALTPPPCQIPFGRVEGGRGLARIHISGFHVAAAEYKSSVTPDPGLVTLAL
jgi:hypothetical protein